MTTPAFEPERGHGLDTVPPLLDLDDPLCADPRVAGGKAASLSVARAGGLPVLGGVVVAAPVSRPSMAKGVDALARRGSGGARLEVSTSSLDERLAAELEDRVTPLGEVLVVRSSSVLEAASQWSGAFTSYLDIHPGEVARAVTGCWASAFAPATLERYEAAGVAPGTADMAVIVQPALHPDFGGTARLEGDDVIVTAVAGSPAPLVQGWEPGAQARVGREGPPRGSSALELMGEAPIRVVAETLRRAHAALHFTDCEWGIVGDEVVLFQLIQGSAARPAPSVPTLELAGTPAASVGRLVRRYPGPLGESLVLPWALGEPEGHLGPAGPLDLDPREALDEATEHAAHLTAEVWSLPREEAARRAARLLSDLRGAEPPWGTITSLRAPDPERSALVLGCLATVRRALAEAGAVTWPELGWYLEVEEVQQILSGKPVVKRQRIGYDRWEPFNAAVVSSEGSAARGTASAPGIGSGRFRWIADPEQMARFRPRDVVVAPYPTPNLAALLWDAAAVVTTGGGPAAHLFESARALAIPAVSAVHLEEALGKAPEDASGEFAVAVDGSDGMVYVSRW